MILIKNLRSFLIDWNNTFVLDKSFRSKNNIAFNSKEHRSTCQIDIYLNFLEDKLFSEHSDNLIEKENKAAAYKKGIWLQEGKIDDEQSAKLFDDFDVNLIEQD